MLPAFLHTEILRFEVLCCERAWRVWAEGPRLRGETEVLPTSAKPVSLQNTEMVPGTRSSSTELQLVSADLLPLGIALQLLQLAQLLCPKK